MLIILHHVRTSLYTWTDFSYKDFLCTCCWPLLQHSKNRQDLNPFWCGKIWKTAFILHSISQITAQLSFIFSQILFLELQHLKKRNNERSKIKRENVPFFQPHLIKIRYPNVKAGVQLHCSMVDITLDSARPLVVLEASCRTAKA